LFIEERYVKKSSGGRSSIVGNAVIEVFSSEVFGF
jgi:hypothetical protein